MVVTFPVPARRHRARAALALVLTHLRAEAASEDTPRALPPPRSSLEIHGRLTHVRLPDDVA